MVLSPRVLTDTISTNSTLANDKTLPTRPPEAFYNYVRLSRSQSERIL